MNRRELLIGLAATPVAAAVTVSAAPAAMAVPTVTTHVVNPMPEIGTAEMDALVASMAGMAFFFRASIKNEKMVWEEIVESFRAVP